MQSILKNKLAKVIIPVLLSAAMLIALFPIKAKAAIYSPASDSIVGAAYALQYSPAPSGYCASWVTAVYKAAGYSANGNACDMWAMVANTGSSDINDLEPGMIIATPSCSYEPGSAGWNYGHVGIYVGDGTVMHSTQGWVHFTDVYTWMELYANHADGRPIMWGYSWDVPYDYYNEYDYSYDEYYDYDEYDEYDEYYDDYDYDYSYGTYAAYGTGAYTYAGLSYDGYIYDDSWELPLNAYYYSQNVLERWQECGGMYGNYGTAIALDDSGEFRELVICSMAYGLPGDTIDFYLSNGAVEKCMILANKENYAGFLSAVADYDFGVYDIIYMATPDAGDEYEVRHYLNGAAITGYDVY